MTYTQDGESVTLEMTRDDFAQLLFAIGSAAGAASSEPDKRRFWSWLRFANEINSGNPAFTPYEIPAEFQL